MGEIRRETMALFIAREKNHEAEQKCIQYVSGKQDWQLTHGER